MQLKTSSISLSLSACCSSAMAHRNSSLRGVCMCVEAGRGTAEVVGLHVSEKTRGFYGKQASPS